MTHNGDRKTRNALGWGAPLVVVLTALILPLAARASAATVTTDKADYAPGETVAVTGFGWQAGETVSLGFDDGLESITFNTLADPEGNIADSEFVADADDAGQTFVLTATGLSSGLFAQTTFTDSPKVVSVSVGSQTPSANPCAGTSATFTVTVARDSAGDTFNATLSVTTALPAGATASFSPNPIVCSPGSCQTSTLTIATTGATPTGTTSFAVEASRNQNDFAFGSGTLNVIGTGGSCDDGNACTFNDVCTSGSCGGTAYTCTPTQCQASSTCDGLGGCTVTNKADDTPCNADSNGCTQNDSCQSGTCTPGSAPNCSDGLSCTTDTCVSTGDNSYTCSNAITPGTCLIGGVCYANGDTNPSNQCQQCSSGTSQTGWSNKTDNTVCNDGNACTFNDVCTSGSCGGTAYSCTPTQCQASSTCDGLGGCTVTNKADDTPCNADSNGCTQNDSCQSGTCTPGSAPNCSDGLSCTTDTCVSTGDNSHTCSNAITPGTCLIGGVCYANGDTNPSNQCQQCSSGSSQTGWSNKTDNTVCNDGNACTFNDVCTSGTCGGTAYTCTPTQCQASSTCDGLGGCTVTNKTDDTPCNADSNGCTQNDSCQSGTCTPGSAPNCSDALSCTTDTCVSTGDNSYTCSNAITPGTCLIGGVCYANGDTNPSNQCQQCSSGSSQTGWSNKTDNTVCNDGNACTFNDVCTSGSCGGTAYTCDDSNVCTDDSCNGDGTCTHTFNGDICASTVTDSSLCTFDVDGTTGGRQFRLIFTPDQNNPSAWKLNASNPGQFYYNVFKSDSSTTVSITLPYPWVTQGAVPIHVYNSVPSIASMNGQPCFVPGTEIANSSTQVTLSNYSPQQFGVTTTVTVTVPAGFAYIDMHLDYGLKGTTGYSKDSNNNAVNAANTSQILIPNGEDYLITDTTGGSDDVMSENVFKRDPGIGGLVQHANGNPVPGVTVQIYDSSNKLLATVYTDQDGWYMWQYKYTGKAATFTVKVPLYKLSQSVTLKSNSFLVVNFTVP